MSPKRRPGRPTKLLADRRTHAVQVSLSAKERDALDAERGTVPAGRYLREAWQKARQAAEADPQ